MSFSYLTKKNAQQIAPSAVPPLNTQSTAEHARESQEGLHLEPLLEALEKLLEKAQTCSEPVCLYIELAAHQMPKSKKASTLHAQDQCSTLQLKKHWKADISWDAQPEKMNAIMAHLALARYNDDLSKSHAQFFSDYWQQLEQQSSPFANETIADTFVYLNLRQMFKQTLLDFNGALKQLDLPTENKIYELHNLAQYDSARAVLHALNMPALKALLEQTLLEDALKNSTPEEALQKKDAPRL